MRSNGAASVTSPRTIASAVSAGWLPFETWRSNPMALNIPHLVGMRVAATCQRMPVCSVLIVSVLVLHARLEMLRCAFFCVRNGATFVQAIDFARAKAQLRENCLVVL